MLFFSPVKSHHLSGLMPNLSAYFFNCADESLLGSTVNETKCTNDVSVLFVSSFGFNASCNCFMLRVSVGQIFGQCVKKKSATTTFPFNESRETVSPN